MKYIRFSIDGVERNGLLEGDKVIELKENFLINDKCKTGNEFNLNEVKLLAPVKPGKVIAIGLNYAAHAAEANYEVPEDPVIFMTSPTAIVGHQEIIRLPYVEHTIDFEAELVVVIGKEATKVKKEDALNYVFGYTCGNDVSDRTLQRKDGQWTRSKSFDTFKPIGPVIATDINPDNLEIKLHANGVMKQHSNTNDLVFKVDTLIEAITDSMTLYPGDIIFTGTPSGVGPIHPEDNIEIEIEGIGKLSNRVEKL